MSIDTTIIFLLINFVVLFLVLKKFLFRPVLTQIEKREDLTTGYQKRAAEFRERTESKIEEYKRILHLTRKEVAEELANIQKEATERQTEIVDAATMKSREIIEKARAELAETTKKAENELKEKIKEISMETAEKILGRKPSVL